MILTRGVPLLGFSGVSSGSNLRFDTPQNPKAPSWLCEGLGLYTPKYTRRL